MWCSSVTMKPQLLPRLQAVPAELPAENYDIFLTISLSRSRWGLKTMSPNILAQTLTLKWTSYPPSRMAWEQSRPQVRLLWTTNIPSSIKHALPLYRILCKKRSVTCSYRGCSQNCIRRENRLKQKYAPWVVAWKQSSISASMTDGLNSPILSRDIA